MDLIKFVQEVEQLTAGLALNRAQHLSLVKGFAELKKELQKDLPYKTASTVMEESKENN